MILTHYQKGSFYKLLEDTEINIIGPTHPSNNSTPELISSVLIKLRIISSPTKVERIVKSSSSLRGQACLHSRSVRCLDRTLLSSHSHHTHSYHRPHTLRTAHPQQPTTAPAIPWSEGAGDYDMIMIVISNVKHSSVLVSKHTIGKVILNESTAGADASNSG